uniref:Uncharacterized protein n=1 Tax=Opuntia streptacantha TaxID=393608 RepID=A0A7C9ACX9_OPUST
MLLNHRGSSVWAILTNSSIAAKASSKYIDLSNDLSIPATLAVDFVGDTTGKAFEIPLPKSGAKGNVLVVTVGKGPNPLHPTPSSKAELGIGGPMEPGKVDKDDIGRPRNLPASAQTRSSSSFKRAFSILRCCSSIEISPIIAGPPQLVQIGFLMASLMDMFSALSLSFSCLRIEFSCRSN